jgi:hypothetical protein
MLDREMLGIAAIFPFCKTLDDFGLYHGASVPESMELVELDAQTHSQWSHFQGTFNCSLTIIPTIPTIHGKCP